MSQIGESIAAAFGWGGPDEPGSLEVTVTERESDEPVAGVKVALLGPTPRRAVTGGDGKARFEELAPGLYWASATQPEFEIEEGKWMAHVGSGDAETMSMRITRILLTVVMKRIDVADRLNLREFAGHWWTEIDRVESYGWYPEDFPGLGTVTGVPGRLNGGRGTGTRTTDARHGQRAEVMFHPRVVNGRPAAAIKDCIRAFARGYGGTWSYPWGQNCHSFQEEMMEHCGMVESGKEAEQ